MTDVDICNLALSRVGVSTFISTLTGTGADPASLCNRIYDITRRRVMTDGPWAFLKLTVPSTDVSSLVTLPAEWSYAYSYPANTLKIRSIDPASKKYPFTVSNLMKADGSAVYGFVVLVNIPDATIEVTYDNTTPSTYPDEFIDAFAWALAAELALPLRADARIFQNCMQGYNNALYSGLAQSLSEGYEEEKLSSFTTARL